MTVQTIPVESPAVDGPLRVLHVWRAVERNWSHVLPPDARALLLRLVDLSLGWKGRDGQWSSSLQAVISGKTRAGETKCGPVGISLRSAHRALGLLVSHGLVETKRLPSGLRFTVNWRFILQRWETPEVPPRLAVAHGGLHPAVAATSQTVGGVPTRQIRCATTADRMCPSGRHKRRGGSEEFGEKSSCSGVGFASADNRFEAFEEETSRKAIPLKIRESEATEEIGESRPKKFATQITAERAAPTVTAQDRAVECIRAEPQAGNSQQRARLIDAVEIIWRNAYATRNGIATEAPAWKKTDGVKALGVFTRWARANGHFDEYLTWVVQNWADVTRTKFAWMKKPPAPDLPDVAFLYAFSDKFEDAWTTRRTKAALSAPELSILEEYRLKGFGHEEAISAIAAKRAANMVRQKPPSRTALPLPVQRATALRADRPVMENSVRGRFIRGRDLSGVEEALFGASALTQEGRR